MGFTRTKRKDPVSRIEENVVGFTCAACHTGQLNYEGTGIRIEGGPALTDLGKFRTAVGQALFYTRWLPCLPFLSCRFDRFAAAVLGEDNTEEHRDKLKADLRRFVKRGKAFKDTVDKLGIYPTEEGFGRLDAVGRIGNFIFAQEISDNNEEFVFGQTIYEENLAVADAPVSFPPIWDTSWFEWVQYNGSFKQPMMRNAGQSLGVFARVNLTDINDPSRLFESTVDVKGVYLMESLIGGEKPFTGLLSPSWPGKRSGKSTSPSSIPGSQVEVLPPIDPELADRGGELYKERCQRCHLPPPSEPDFWKHWTQVSKEGKRYLKVNMIPLDRIGTDPVQAKNLVKREVNLGLLGSKIGTQNGIVAAGVALKAIIQKTVERRYNDMNLSPAARDRYNGRKEDDIQAPLAYRVRPLNGIWATAPFLHNGSVPNLYQLLSPVAERDKRFYLGSKEFDPVHVGFSTENLPGGFELDTSLPGNSNAGHEFRGSRDPNDDQFFMKLGKGVIGPELTEKERMALIEFLKAMEPPDAEALEAIGDTLESDLPTD